MTLQKFLTPKLPTVLNKLSTHLLGLSFSIIYNKIIKTVSPLQICMLFIYQRE